MANFHEGYKDIKVTLVDFPSNISYMATEFNKFGSEELVIPMEDVHDFTDTFIKGKTFPKYVLEGNRFTFSIEGISRICLAQLTRDNAIFCSESHGLRPLSMDINVPLSFYNNESIMDKFKKAQYLIEEAYIEACEKEIPYPDTRYLGLHAQTISVCASYTVSSFIRSCHSRTNNSFCDELNYVYRKMYNCLVKYINDNTFLEDYKIWKHLINDESCIDDSFYTRTRVFNGDFSLDVNENCKVEYTAQNDWRNSAWFLELKRIYNEENELLTKKEKEIISKYFVNKNELPTSYNKESGRIAKETITIMDYYKEHRK